MNSCRCNSKTFWKRNLNLTGDSSLQWSSWRPLIIDFLHTVVILEHKYDIKIVTWKHKPSLNNYVSMFLFLGISYWFAFWDLCSDVCSADHIFCPCVRLCFPCRGCRSRIHTSAAPEGSSASLECHRELPHKKPHVFGSQAQVFFSSSFPWAAEVGLTGHCSLVGCSHSCPPDWHFHCFPCAGSHLPPLCDLRDSPVSKIPNPSNKAKTCVGILLIWLVQRHCWWPAEHPMKHGEGMGRGAGHSKAVVTLTYLPARLASKLQNCASSKDGQDKWYLSKIVIF